MIKTIFTFLKLIIGGFFLGTGAVAYYTATYDVAGMLLFLFLIWMLLEYLDSREKIKKPTCCLYHSGNYKCEDCPENQNLRNL